MKRTIVASRGRNPDNPSDRKQHSSVLVGAEIGVAIGGKTPCLTTEYAHRWNSYGLQHVMDIEYIGCAMRQRDRKDEGKAQNLEIRGGDKANSLTTVNKDSMVMIYEDCMLCEKAEM